MATKPTTPKTPKAPARPRAASPKAASLKAARPNAAKPKAAADQAAPMDGGADNNAKAASGLRLKDLIEQVTTRTGVKKKDVKSVLDAALAQMAAALKQGESLNLAGLGRMRVARAAAEVGGAMTLKLRLGGSGEKAGKPDAEPLADGDDQD